MEVSADCETNLQQEVVVDLYSKSGCQEVKV